MSTEAVQQSELASEGRQVLDLVERFFRDVEGLAADRLHVEGEEFLEAVLEDLADAESPPAGVGNVSQGVLDFGDGADANLVQIEEAFEEAVECLLGFGMRRVLEQHRKHQ